MSWVHRVLGRDGASQLGVDASHFAARVSPRPLEHGTRGHYRLAISSGLLTGVGVTAAGTVFSARWTDATKLCVLTRLSAYYTVTTAFTAVQEIGLDAVVARSWTVADTAGTALTLATNDQKVRTTHATSLFTTASSLRVATATIITAGTRTVDTNPFAGVSGVTHDPNAAAATAQLVATPRIGFDFLAAPGDGESPIVLAANEGVVVRNTVVFPAAGAARLWVVMVWTEVDSY